MRAHNVWQHLYIETFHHICYALLSSHAYIRNILQSYFIHLRVQLHSFRGIVRAAINILDDKIILKKDFVSIKKIKIDQGTKDIEQMQLDNKQFLEDLSGLIEDS